MSGEATSPDNHMSAVDRRLNIMSGGGTSSNKATLDESASGKELKSDSPLFLDELQGNAIHCSARSNVAHNFIKLKEGIIYCIKNFVVHPNKEEYRIRKDDAFMLEFNGATSARKSLAKGVGFDTSLMLEDPFNNEQALEPWNSTWPMKGDTLIEKKTKDVGHCAIILTAMNVKTYNNKLYLSSSSSTQIFDDPNIPALKELRSEIRKLGGWWCDACDKAVEYPVLRYRLELGISDATTHVVVVMFDETAFELVKCSADSLVQSDEEYLDDTSALPAALANIIGTTHTLELKSQPYYEHGTFESFTCWNLIPPEIVVESASSSTIDIVPDTSRSSGKRLCKQPSVATPLKPCEGKTPISQELEDSDADSLPVQAEGKKKQRVSQS
ncbi:nucleic acid-binding, OB-fold protein, partial [Tanacetum coccineum]